MHVIGGTKSNISVKKVVACDTILAIRSYSSTLWSLYSKKLNRFQGLILFWLRKARKVEWVWGFSACCRYHRESEPEDPLPTKT